MTMKRYSIFPVAPELLQRHHQKTIWGRLLLLCRDAVSVFYGPSRLDQSSSSWLSAPRHNFTSGALASPCQSNWIVEMRELRNGYRCRKWNRHPKFKFKNSACVSLHGNYLGKSINPYVRLPPDMSISSGRLFSLASARYPLPSLSSNHAASTDFPNSFSPFVPFIHPS